MLMEIYLIEGPTNIGKSSLIMAQYLRCVNTGNFKEIYNYHPDSLSNFIYVIENLSTGDYILFNSATDDWNCIDRFDQTINRFHGKLTKIVTSIRDTSSPKLHQWTMDIIHKYYPGIPKNTTYLGNLLYI